MAKEIVAWCDLHLARDNAQVPASTVHVMLDRMEPVELDLCDPCDKELVQPLRLFIAEHGQPVAQQARPTSSAKKTHACTLCSKSYKRADNLRQHVAKTHSGLDNATVGAPVEPNLDGTYTCPECADAGTDRVFEKPQGVGRHRLAIHGVKGSSRSAVAKHARSVEQ